MKDNKKLLLVIGVILVIVGITASFTYAFLSVGGKQGTPNIFNTNKCLNISIENEGNAISLENAFPITDLEGLETEGYTFTIRNTCSEAINYQINLESLNESANSLNADYIKVALSSDTSDNLVSILSSNTRITPTISNAYEAYNLDTGVLLGNSSKSFKLREWMDYDTTKEQGASKIYTSKINVIANPDLEVNIVPYIKTSVNVLTLTGNITGTASTLNYCTSVSSVCTPNINLAINNNVATLAINRNDKQIICSKLDNNKTLCSDVIGVYIDNEVPIISNVATSVTKTEINVTVSASDDKGVTEYWYQIDSNTPIKKTTNTHQFTGLSAGSTHTIKVYVKDAVGNQSDTVTKSVTTEKPPASETILNNITYKTTVPDFNQAATTDEGVYSVSDGMYGGTSYYWRGAVTNNYVIFASKCWRIIRINGDGTIRLIYDGTTCHANGTSTAESIAKTDIVYNSSYNQSNYVGWTYTGTSQRTTSGTASNAKTQLESWYISNITGTNATKVADGKYCNDRNAASDYTWAINGSAFYYAVYTRWNDNSPTLSCPTGDVYTLKAGLITMDEVMYAGGKGANNTSYYLYNGQSYWTMSPGSWNGTYARVFYVYENGALGNDRVHYTAFSLRPVINLRSDVTFISGGTGTQSNPYVVEGAE